jgi:hypothetical protein
MDRNEEFRKRLDKRLNKGGLVSKRGFDPTPYVDILMERVDYEDYDEVEDLQAFIDDVLEDPAFDFIFGKSSLMNTDQKSHTAAMLLERIDAYHDFDPEPHAQSLMDVYGTPAFDKYLETDDDDEEEDYDDEEYYNFEPYFAEHALTKEQKYLVEGAFHNLQRGKSPTRKGKNVEEIVSPKYAFRLLLITIAVVVVPSFFIPNLLQRFGWLPCDAGWFMKIGVWILSLIVFFFSFTKVIQVFVNRALKKNKQNVQ